MSQINDALRKARQSQPARIQAAAGPLLRPIKYTARPASRIFGFALILVLVLLLAGIFLAAWYFAGHSSLLVRAHTVSATAPFDVLSSNSPSDEPRTPGLAASSDSNAPATPAAVSEPITNPSYSSNSHALAEAFPELTRSDPTPPPPQPQVIYRLQGLFFRPKNPAALINGRMVYVGGAVGGARVIAIDEHSATVVTTTGQTNVLSLAGENPSAQLR